MFTDPIADERFKALHSEFEFPILFETGTGEGLTSLKAADFCDVITVESKPEVREKAIKRWKDAGFTQVSPANFYCYRRHRGIISTCGNSPDTIAAYEFIGFPCFYLDAHGDDYWPLLDELKAIAVKHLPRCVIIIHDCKVPGKPWGYDSYKGQDLDLAYVKPFLDQINPDFKISFNEESASPNPRGILYATP